MFEQIIIEVDDVVINVVKKTNAKIMIKTKKKRKQKK